MKKNVILITSRIQGKLSFWANTILDLLYPTKPLDSEKDQIKICIFKNICCIKYGSEFPSKSFIDCLSTCFVKLNYIDGAVIVQLFSWLYQFDYPFLIVSWDLPSLARTFNAVYTASAHFFTSYEQPSTTFTTTVTEETQKRISIFRKKKK